MKSSATIHRLKVTLRHIRPPVWRTVEAPAGLTLFDLHRVLQAAMGWTNSHLHLFRHRKIAYGTATGDFNPRDMASERQSRLGDLLQQPGDLLTYEYDFGDGWEHDIVLEAVEAAGAGLKYPRVVAGKRACPPEDVGGPPGYESFLAAIADPRHDDHAGMMDWSGGAFDPEAFDLIAANDAIPVRRKALISRR